MQSALAVSSDQMNFCVAVQPVPPYSTGHAGATQPFLLEHLVPREKIFLRKLVAFVLLAAQFGRIIFSNEAADLFAKRELFRRKLKIHGDSPNRYW